MSATGQRIYVGSEQVFPLLTNLGLELAIPPIEEALVLVGLEMSRLNLSDPVGLCVAATRILKDILVRAGVESSIVGGEIRLAPGDFMEHRISLFKRERVWVALDLTAGQFSPFKGADLIAITSAPTATEMLKQLRDHLSWA